MTPLRLQMRHGEECLEIVVDPDRRTVGFLAAGRAPVTYRMDDIAARWGPEDRTLFLGIRRSAEETSIEYHLVVDDRRAVAADVARQIKGIMPTVHAATSTVLITDEGGTRAFKMVTSEEERDSDGSGHGAVGDERPQIRESFGKDRAMPAAAPSADPSSREPAPRVPAPASLAPRASVPPPAPVTRSAKKGKRPKLSRRASHEPETAADASPAEAAAPASTPAETPAATSPGPEREKEAPAPVEAPAPEPPVEEPPPPFRRPVISLSFPEDDPGWIVARPVEFAARLFAVGEAEAETEDRSPAVGDVADAADPEDER